MSSPVKPYLLTTLRAPLQGVLAHIATIARQQGASVWLVGGVVRDLLLGVPVVRDLDLAVEGDAVALAHSLAAQAGGQVSASHQAFGTATVVLDDSLEGESLVIDLAGTRTESYPHPAALPVVQPATIAQDLARRDFSINAMALKVEETDEYTAQHGSDSTPIHCPQFLDPFDGQRDLTAGVLRVLHDQSFVDDPTRILRGLRLAARLHFHFDAQTRTLLAAALAGGYLEATTPDRIRTELCLVLDEPQPETVLHLADTLAITPHIFAPLQQPAPRYAQLACQPHHPPLVRAGLLTYDLDMPEREELIRRYRLPGDAAKLLRDVGSLRSLLAEIRRPGLRNSELDQRLRPFSTTALDVVGYAEGGSVQEAITHYNTELRTMTTLLDGHMLQQLGIAPGPQLGSLLRELRAARLDGKVATRADEEAWVQQHATDHK